VIFIDDVIYNYHLVMNTIVNDLEHVIVLMNLGQFSSLLFFINCSSSLLVGVINNTQQIITQFLNFIRTLIQ